MPDNGPDERPDATLVERYEQLRSGVLTCRADGHRLGLGVLTSKGMAAWMHAWTACPAPPRPVVPPTATAVRPPPGWLASELVAVLAQMALAHT